MTLKLYLKMQGLPYALRRILEDNQGHDRFEYALAMLLMAGAAAAGIATVATKINQAFTSIGAKLSAYTN